MPSRRLRLSPLQLFPRAVQRPANYPSGIQVQYHSQVEPLAIHLKIRDISSPLLVWPCRRFHPHSIICGTDARVSRQGLAPIYPACLAYQANIAHQELNMLLVDSVAVCTQLRINAWAAVIAIVFNKYLFNFLRQSPILHIPYRLFPVHPLVKSSG